MKITIKENVEKLGGSKNEWEMNADVQGQFEDQLNSFAQFPKGAIYNENDGLILHFPIAPADVSTTIRADYARVLPFKNSRERGFYGGTRLQDFTFTIYLSVAHSLRVGEASKVFGASRLEMFGDTAFSKYYTLKSDAERQDFLRTNPQVKTEIERQKGGFKTVNRMVRFLRSLMYRESGNTEFDTPTVLVFASGITTQAKLISMQTTNMLCQGRQPLIIQVNLTFMEIHDQHGFTRKMVYDNNSRVDFISDENETTKNPLSKKTTEREEAQNAMTKEDYENLEQAIRDGFDAGPDEEIL